MDPVSLVLFAEQLHPAEVPELQGIKGPDIHSPWALNSASVSQVGGTLVETYPQPAVERHISQRLVSSWNIRRGWKGSRSTRPGLPWLCPTTA